MRKFILIFVIFCHSIFAGEIRNDDPNFRRDVLNDGKRLTNSGNYQEGAKYFYYGVINWLSIDQRADQEEACINLFASYYRFKKHIKRAKTLDPCPTQILDELYGRTDRDYLPLVKYAPKIPMNAVHRKQDGVVMVEYTVNAKGKVQDVVIVESTDKMFDKPAIVAAKKFIYICLA